MPRTSLRLNDVTENYHHLHSSRTTGNTHSHDAGSSFSCSSNLLNFNDIQTASTCSTKVEPLHLSQNWIIENFQPLLKLCKPGHCLRSHVFRHPLMPEANWQLCMYPAGKRSENAGFVSLFLKMSSASPNREILITAEYKFYFMDEHKQTKFSNVNVGDFHAKPPKCGHSWGLRNIPRSRVVSSLASDGSLFVHCEVEFLPDPCKLRSQAIRPFNSSIISKEYFSEESVPKIFVKNMLRCVEDQSEEEVQQKQSSFLSTTDDFDHLISGSSTDFKANQQYHFDLTIFVPKNSLKLNNSCAAKFDVYSHENQNEDVATSKEIDDDNDDDMDEDDMQIEPGSAGTTPDMGLATNFVQYIKFRAHKFILAAHSEVFRAMFDHSDLLESQRSRIIIEDFSPKVVRSLLRYLYSCGTDFGQRSIANNHDQSIISKGHDCDNYKNQNVGQTKIRTHQQLHMTIKNHPNFDSKNSPKLNLTKTDQQQQQQKIDNADQQQQLERYQQQQMHDEQLNSILDLMMLAEKYSIFPLKVQCENYLVQNITNSNVCRLLAVADLHLAQNLKKFCFQYFADHRRELNNLRDWHLLKNNNCSLSSEVLEFVLQNANNSSSTVISGCNGYSNTDDFYTISNSSHGHQSTSHKRARIEHGYQGQMCSSSMSLNNGQNVSLPR